jgi:hypothetical protein
VVPQQVLEAHPRFKGELRALRTQWRNELPWTQVRDAALRISKEERWLPKNYQL